MTTSVVFSHEEYARRLAAMRAKMPERAAELVLVDEAEHLAYLTGFDRSATRYQACAIPLEGDPVTFLRALDEPSFLERSTVRRWQTLTAALPTASFVDFGEVLRELRLHKSSEEIALLRRAASIADRAMAAAVAAAGEGRNEREAADDRDAVAATQARASRRSQVCSRTTGTNITAVLMRR